MMRPYFLAVLHVNGSLQADPEATSLGEFLQLGDLNRKRENGETNQTMRHFFRALFYLVKQALTTISVSGPTIFCHFALIAARI